MSKTLNFLIKINAPKEKVWGILWSKDTYPKWTTVFAEGSDDSSDWKEGSSILFTDGKGSGMYSSIERKVQNKQMTFKHLGVLKDGVEQPIDEPTQSWSGCIEDYQLEETNGVTELKVRLNSMVEYLDYFQDKFPKALQKVKELSEQS
ncbi:MAG: SRPBCC domain-containing protein [Aquaticitalea sp.]